MVTDRQVRRLFAQMAVGASLRVAALRAGVSEPTARRYRRMKRLPSEAMDPRSWRTRPDPFVEVWPQVEEQLRLAPTLEAKTLFEWLQSQHPEKFEAGQLRTLQRQVKRWRAMEGPAKEVFFDQVHRPGDLCASDFTHLGGLGVTIAGGPFDHLLYHFVLTYSNWESVTLCHSESFESLSQGLQHALWQLGGVPLRHRSDRLSAAVNNLSDAREFTRRYTALLGHYGLRGEKIRPRQAHENGDVESSHGHFKQALEQALLLRGSRDFLDPQAYEQFLHELVARRNLARRTRLAEEQALLRALPARRLESFSQMRVPVHPSSLIHVQRNTYSVHSRLIGEAVEVRIHADHLEIWYGQTCVDRLPRLRGRRRHAVQYRHLIDWLLRKPGAFANYRYRDDLFPTSRFRMAYDVLCDRRSSDAAVKDYLEILRLAAQESESRVDDVLRTLLDEEAMWTIDTVRQRVLHDPGRPAATAIEVDVPDLRVFDLLLDHKEVYDGYEYGCELTTDQRLAGAEVACVPR